ncbi:peroxide stress protein YaaA [Candidatus Uabimicrobium sp. HlEnr_7]|uniref:peroxide stress protein YaaA n=1 Tax=Candidatus Uabimicrobium helgolandensis TaxID=3095367 RepID=UPI003558BA97
MLFVISPSKTLDFETPGKIKKHSLPDFLDDAQTIVNKLQKLSEKKIAKFMNISPKLAELNRQRYQEWQLPFTSENAKQAMYAFKGDVYAGLNAEKFTGHDSNFAQKHLRILSGLYGILRPLDLIRPYRLEMGRELKIGRKKNLYDFWQKKITQTLQEELNSAKENILVNLASNEYFQAVSTKELGSKIITPVFKDMKNGKYKMISFYAKKARGLMVHYAVKNRVKNVEQLKEFDSEGYYFSPEMSDKEKWVFLREEQ